MGTEQGDSVVSDSVPATGPWALFPRIKFAFALILDHHAIANCDTLKCQESTGYH